MEGRLEICLNEEWGTVCNNEWDTVDAAIACKQLGYVSAGTYNSSYSNFSHYAHAFVLLCFYN